MGYCILKLSVNSFLGLAHPHADQITGQDTPEGQRKLTGYRFGKKRLPATRRSIEEDSISNHTVLGVFAGLHPANTPSTVWLEMESSSMDLRVAGRRFLPKR